jgi:N6-adenosine-specific RNA methylase IME4
VADDAALFLWVPGPFLAIGAHLPIMRAWGFKPSGMGFVWTKLKPKASPLMFSESDLAMGGGFTTRKNAEFCLIGKRGHSVRVDRAIREVILAPRREHSRKPDEFYARVERYAGDCRRLDLFARQRRHGWDCFGDQVEMFGEAGPCALPAKAVRLIGRLR